MTYEPYPCENCGKTILSDDDDFHFEIGDRNITTVPAPYATTVCTDCWTNEGFKKEYNKQFDEKMPKYAFGGGHGWKKK